MSDVKELTQEQINQNIINNTKLSKISGAENIILEALNTMKKQAEPNIIQPEDIYPELWKNLVTEVVEVVDNMEAELAIKVKDIIKRTSISEKTNPILKKSLRPVREEGDTSLFTSPKYLKLSSTYESRDPEEVIDIAIGRCLNDDLNNFYHSDYGKEMIKNGIESLKNPNITDMLTYFCSFDNLRDAIIEGEISASTLHNIFDTASNIIGGYAVADILYTIFVPDYKTNLYIDVFKCRLINNMIQTQIMKEAREEAEAKKENDTEEESCNDSSPA